MVALNLNLSSWNIINFKKNKLQIFHKVFNQFQMNASFQTYKCCFIHLKPHGKLHFICLSSLDKFINLDTVYAIHRLCNMHKSQALLVMFLCLMWNPQEFIDSSHYQNEITVCRWAFRCYWIILPSYLWMWITGIPLSQLIHKPMFPQIKFLAQCFF